MRSVGAPIWPEIVSDPGSYNRSWENQLRQAGDAYHVRLNLFMYTADGGSDQSLFKKVVASGTMSSLF
eukprot:1148120-Pyramimonas_sp.AAC.1